jgi:hypothetical protein
MTRLIPPQVDHKLFRIRFRTEGEKCSGHLQNKRCLLHNMGDAIASNRRVGPRPSVNMPLISNSGSDVTFGGQGFNTHRFLYADCVNDMASCVGVCRIL